MEWQSRMIVAGVVLLAACSDGNPNGTSQVDVGMSASGSATPAASSAFLAESQTDSSGNTLVIQSVSVVVRRIKLERAACGDVDDSAEVRDSTHFEPRDSAGGDVEVALSDSAEHEIDDDDCPVLRAGPILVDLPLGGGVDRQFTVTVDTGTYSSARFLIRPLFGQQDTAFTAAHPEMAGASIRVTGTYNGAPFDFKTAVTDVQRVRFSPPLVVGADPVSFTISVDLSGWFRGMGGVLIDPSTATGMTMNAWIVRFNIFRSFHAFRDEDHDGHDDGMEH